MKLVLRDQETFICPQSASSRVAVNLRQYILFGPVSSVKMISRKRRSEPCAIEVANGKNDNEFLKDYIQKTGGPAEWASTWRHPSSGKDYEVSLTRSALMSATDLTACLGMVELTSGEDYHNSSVGWDRDAKLAEMKSPDLRYILVRDAAGVIAAFTSLMPTYEEGQPVVYCYEIHLLDQVRRTGLGKLLMGYLLNAAANMPPVDKVMLSCFAANTGARTFYNKMGFEIDELSPQPRRLRGGRTREPDYLILSCAIGRSLRDQQQAQQLAAASRNRSVAGLGSKDGGSSLGKGAEQATTGWTGSPGGEGRTN
ncbi:hypothetical protein RB597_003481 [Gaeumannomyces tritici]